jgi:transcriptional regulator with XRE-family HTH domain
MTGLDLHEARGGRMSTGKVGRRVAALRETKKVSLEELSARSGLEVEFIRDLEHGAVHPPLAPLLRIARGLGVRLGTFIDDAVSQDPYLVRVADRQEELTSARGKNTPTALRFHSLGKGKSDRHMEPFFVEILEESANDDTVSSHEGEEFLVVVSGRVEVLYAGRPHQLGPGDSIYYNSIVPHRVSSVGGPASIYAVLYFPA